MSMLDHIAAKLTTDLGLVVGTSMFLDYLPEDPDVLVALFDYTSKEPLFTMGTTLVHQHHRLQVLTRDVGTGAGTLAAKAQARAVYNSLRTVVNATLSGVRYMEIQPVGEPALMERDEKKRPLYVVNFDITKEPSE